MGNKIDRVSRTLGSTLGITVGSDMVPTWNVPSEEDKASVDSEKDGLPVGYAVDVGQPETYLIKSAAKSAVITRSYINPKHDLDAEVLPKRCLTGFINLSVLSVLHPIQMILTMTTRLAKCVESFVEAATYCLVMPMIQRSY